MEISATEIEKNCGKCVLKYDVETCKIEIFHHMRALKIVKKNQMRTTSEDLYKARRIFMHDFR